MLLVLCVVVELLPDVADLNYDLIYCNLVQLVVGVQ